MRIVFDTNTVISALLFPNGRLGCLRAHWRQRECVPVISSYTAAEVARVLGHRKFKLSDAQIKRLLRRYLTYCEVVYEQQPCTVLCRDPNDQPFLDLCISGGAEVLVTGDEDLLVLAGTLPFAIERPAEYLLRFGMPSQT